MTAYAVRSVATVEAQSTRALLFLAGLFGWSAAFALWPLIPLVIAAIMIHYARETPVPFYRDVLFWVIFNIGFWPILFLGLLFRHWQDQTAFSMSLLAAPYVLGALAFGLWVGISYFGKGRTYHR